MKRENVADTKTVPSEKKEKNRVDEVEKLQEEITKEKHEEQSNAKEVSGTVEGDEGSRIQRDRPNPPRDTKPRCCKCKYRRYYIAVMAFLGYLVAYGTRVNLSVAIVFMTQKSNRTYSNGTVYVHQEFSWDANTQGTILASFFYGYLVTQIPGGYLSGTIGGHHVLNIGVLGSGLLSFFVPWAAKFEVPALVAVRVICGLFQGLTIPALSDVWSFWAPPLERTILTGIAFSGNYFSSIIIMPLCSVIGETIGWEWTFYIFAVLAVIWCLVWGLTVARSPRQDWYVTDEEADYIERAIGKRPKTPKHPWLRILTSCAVLAIITAYIAHNIGFYTIMTFGPKFFTETLHYDVKYSATFSGVAMMITGILVQSMGQLSDLLRRRNMMTTRNVRRLMGMTGYALAATFLSAVAASSNRTVVTVSVIMAIGFGGIAVCAYYVNALDIAAPHAAVIVGIANTFGTLPAIVMPAIYGLAMGTTLHPTLADWRVLWYTSIAGYVLGFIVFGFFSQGEQQSWVHREPDGSVSYIEIRRGPSLL